MSNHKNLVFFNKEGDYLNFNYNSNTDRFEGDVLFHENSSDTYKTAGVYMLEKVDSFDYEVPGELGLNKFQLFNEYGLHFYSAKYFTQSVTKIEPINNDPSFYSKWIYGVDFETKFPVGSIIKFNSIFTEFTDVNRTYCVVNSKKNAIMIISQIDNASFESLYYTTYTDLNNYLNLTISGCNLIGVYNYIDNQYNNNLSRWSEPDFYDKYHVGKKINIVDSEKNDGTVTVTNIDVTDQVHFEYYTSPASLPFGSELIIEVNTRMDLPKVYEGGLTILANNRIGFDVPTIFPKILKPGIEFKVVGSVNNDIFFTVSPVPSFEGITNEIFFSYGDQVYYNNQLYQCINAYTQSFGSFSSREILPDNTNYWSKPTYVTVDQSTVAETLLNGQVYLTTDRFYFGYPFTYSAAATLASAAEKYKNDLLSFNIDLYYIDNKLKADLKYPSPYAFVNFYQSVIGPTYSIGSVLQTNERVVQVKENLNYELNYNYSANFKYNVVFTDIDEFGIKLVINKQVYDEEVAFVYSGLVIDMERTIDRTLRNWLARNFLSLYVLGVEAELAYIGNFYSPFFNSIVLKTHYPNVPLSLDNVLVGSTADYHIEHSRVLFYDIGPYMSININGDDYGVFTLYGTGSTPDIGLTLNTWHALHAETLLEFKIIVTQINNLLKFDIKELDRRLDYTISTGKLKIPGISDYVITDKLPGSKGMLIASNEIVLSGVGTASFEQDGFATGMVVAINNTIYPYNNIQYNIQFLDPLVMDLSYEGPFWAVGDFVCNFSPFVTLGFSLGFGQTGCEPIPGPTGASAGGPFNLLMFSASQFSVTLNPNNYVINYYNLNSYPGTTNLVDIIYIQLSETVYGFGDNLVALDSYNGSYISTTNLPGNTQSIEIEFNPINNYLYCLSAQQINIVDPLLNTLVANISLTASVGTSSALAFDMAINPVNGDVYVTFQNFPIVQIFDSNNFTSTVTQQLSATGWSNTGAMVFNDFESDMYITTGGDSVIRVNSNRTVQTTYGITGVTHSIFYEPVNEAVYVYASSSLWKIDNGITQSVNSITTTGFNDIIYNNLSGEINISNATTNFSRLNLSTNSATQFSVANYGYLALNQFDGDVYLSSQNLNNIIVVRPTSNQVVYTAPMAAQTTRLVYNPDRKSVWAIQPSQNTIVEVEVQVNSLINLLPATYSEISDFQYGTLDADYVPRENLWLKTDDYVRRPRENFEGDTQVQYYWRWFSDNIPQFFFYDTSGDQLPTSGSYAYVGEKPLTNPTLNKLPNKDIDKVGMPEFQQTVFPKIEYTLSYLDDEDDISTEVTPLQLFIGFRSEEEGALKSIFQLFKKEDVEFGITASLTTYITFETIDIENTTGNKRGQIRLFSDSEAFTGKGLKPGQWVKISNKDVSNDRNQYISDNNGIYVKIREVYTKYLIVDFFNLSTDFLTSEITRIQNYPKTNKTTYLRTSFKVVDREIGRFFTWGQSEIEDIRFDIELSNVGKLIAPNEVFIFKEYDINEGATDWIFLNKKRKEMLMMKNLIYPYIGAYKSLINAINYFGYNDLQLNEYYRDINTSSSNFGKLFKIEIPDIFDNTVEGWKENDFIKGFSDENYEVTNMFNLTYFITDKDGNNILTYTLDEVLIKLQGLKYWLKKNIIPITHKILDITGRAYVRNGNYITHRVQEIKTINMSDNMTPIIFDMNETYLMPVNSGSTVYNCVIDFYSIVPLRPGLTAGVQYNGLTVNPEKYTFFENTIDYNGKLDPVYNSPNRRVIPRPYNLVEVDYPDYFTLNIRTYQTYPEWNPFQIYNIGDKVTYLGEFYQSSIDDNKLKNPTNNSQVAEWSPTEQYTVPEKVKYNGDLFVYSGLGATFSATQSSPTPLVDTGNWLKITEWKKINLSPIQTIKEYRKGRDLRPFNFTLDSNIDPYVTISLSTDNGYGCAYTYKKHYEIRGLRDIRVSTKPLDPIGPFNPIKPVY